MGFDDSQLATIYDLNTHKLALNRTRSVFYLTQTADWFFTLQCNLPIQVIPIPTSEVLMEYLSIRMPDLIVIDKDFETNTLELIVRLQSLMETPIVLIAPKEKKSSRFIKKAYLSGIHDVLFDPVDPEEWQEIAKPLLKIKTTHSQSH